MKHPIKDSIMLLHNFAERFVLTVGLIFEKNMVGKKHYSSFLLWAFRNKIAHYLRLMLMVGPPHTRCILSGTLSKVWTPLLNEGLTRERNNPTISRGVIKF